MSCSGCSTGRGCGTASGQLPGGCRNNGACGVGGCNKLNVFDWLADMELPGGQKVFDCVEVRFKNSRKEFYRNNNPFSLKVGDVVAVEASPGHDIGIVSLAGELVRTQMKKKNINSESPEIKKVYRLAKQSDIDKWKEAQALEQDTMMKARTIARFLKLEMKISDVEYQGDKSKAIFYYTAEGRVDFRQLIKDYAGTFKVRIEMKQITLRHEASRVGGIGDCGRELCCSTWLTDFRAVNTTAARYQQLSINPVKLAGQCGKLKCCLNYELDSYLDAIKDFPNPEIKLETTGGLAFHMKTDIFKRKMWYVYENERGVFIELSVDRVKEVIALNKAGKKPDELRAAVQLSVPKIKEPDYQNVVGQDSISRFDRSKNNNNRNRGRNNNRNRNRR
ncbi:MAG: stage 0 sporulation family protein [Bacteroidia bacterium]